AEREERRRSGVTEAPGVASASRSRHDVLDGARDFHTDEIVARIDAKRRTVQRYRSLSRESLRGRRERNGARQTASDFFSKARPRQRTTLIVRTEFVRVDLMR